MKKFYIMALSAATLLSMSGCVDTFLDLNPQDQKTDVVYFNKPSDFKEYTAGIYGQLLGWKTPYNKFSVYNFMDSSSDLAADFVFSADVGRGTIAVTGNDDRWNKAYEHIRTDNILLDKASSYPGDQKDIAPYLAEAYFFRAYNYFFLLKTFGGVPITKTALSTNSTELYGSRNSRYEVVDLILSDLQYAIDNLPIEQNISSADKGRVSKWAAEAFKARVLLYEATWRKYNGTSTDFAGSAGPVKDQINDFLDEAIALNQEVMNNGGYEIWNYNSNEKIKNQSNLYLFNLEDEGSNPAGLTKDSNKEFILYGIYDINLRPGGINLSHTVSLMSPSRKFMDMFLCTNGLPIEKSKGLFKGYHKTGDEFANRDLRLMNYIGGGTNPAEGSVTLGGGLAGYGCYKFKAYQYGIYRQAEKESQNYPVLRLAEVYLNYAEACYERYGKITNAQLSGLNQLRARAGIEPLTVELVEQNGLDMLDEIRRERAVELYLEGYRFDDLKRWGIAEEALNASRCGMVVGGDGYETEFKTADGDITSKYQANTFIWGEEKVKTGDGELYCTVISSSKNHSFKKKHYLWPIPQDQINLNRQLKQNPGY